MLKVRFVWDSLVGQTEKDLKSFKFVHFAFYSLNVPGEMLRPVYSAASALRLDRAANECARFMAR